MPQGHASIIVCMSTRTGLTRQAAAAVAVLVVIGVALAMWLWLQPGTTPRADAPSGGSSASPAAAGPTSTLMPTDSSLTSDGRIAFCTEIDGRRAGGSERSDALRNTLYTMEPDGSDITVLKSGCWGPVAWSVDGTQLLFGDLDGELLAAFVRDADGGIRRLPEPDGLIHLTYPAWSPDGTRVVVLSAESVSEQWGLFTVDLDDGDWRRVPITMPLGPAAWSSTDVLAFTVVENPNTSPDAIYRAAPDGSDPRMLLNSTGQFVCCLDWSPDGSQLAFAAGVEGPVEPIAGAPFTCQRVGMVNADGTGFAWLTPESGCAYDPQWSPDGRQIGFIQVGDDELGHLWIAEAGGGEPLEVLGVNLGDSNVWYAQQMWDWR